MNLQKSKQQGFTIVELLIVIVVIAILAAISIVAYNGVQNRAKASTANAAADNVIKKAELYNTEESKYPENLEALTSADAGKTYFLNASSVVIEVPVQTAAFTTAPDKPNTVRYDVCKTGTPAQNTGAKIQLWDYAEGKNKERIIGKC